MKRTEIKFPHETKDSFLRRCMDCEHSANQELVNVCVADAKDVEEFIDLYLSHKEEVGSQFYDELLMRERPNRFFYAIREQYGDRQFKTCSDAGSVRIGNDSLSILIPNGYGDGITRVAIFDKAEFVLDNLMCYYTSISTSSAHVYDYDCDGGQPIRTISGNYAVYRAYGFVALVKETL